MTILLGDYPVVLLLVLFRVAALIFMLPFFGIMRGSGRLLAGASLPVALLFCTVLPPEYRDAAAQLSTPGDVAWALIGEALLGAAVGAVCGAFTGAFYTAGMIAERGTSLSMAQDMDPITGQSSGLLSQIMQMLFFLIILALNAHLMVIEGVARSFEHLPAPWIGWMTCGLDLARLGGMTLSAGVLLAMPVLVVSTVVTLAMALMARFAQEFNVMFLSLPFRVVSGLFVLGLGILFGETAFRNMAQDMLYTLARFLTS